jgi:DNA-binding CsgD family transcriptional regulator
MDLNQNAARKKRRQQGVPVPTPTSASRVRAAEKRTSRVLVRCAGEHRIPYRKEVLDVMARYVVRDQLADWPPMPEVAPEPKPVPQPPKPVPVPKIGLSQTDAQVLRLVAAGLENLDIGGRLGLTEHGVKTRLKRVFLVLEARNRAHAVARGFEVGILTAGSAS